MGEAENEVDTKMGPCNVCNLMVLRHLNIPRDTENALNVKSTGVKREGLRPLTLSTDCPPTISRNIKHHDL